MKILIVDNTELISNGVDFCIESRAGEFKLELKNCGNQIAVFGQKLKPAENSIHVFGLNENGIAVKGLWRKKNKLLNYLLLYGYAFLQIRNYDFIYLFYPGSFRYIAFLCAFLNKPFGIYIRGLDDLDDRVSKSIYNKANLIFTVSDLFTNKINQFLGTPKAKTIRPMIPYSEADIVENRKYTRKEKYKILYFGRIAEEKGMNELVEATLILSRKRADFTIEIYGDGEYYKQTEKRIAELSLESLVALYGPEYDIVKIRAIYSEADIFILPTYHEGFPRTLYEAMIFGTPIVTTLVGGIPQLMSDKVNCRTIEVKSVDSIVNVLTSMLDDYESVTSIANNSTNTIKNLLTTRKKSHALDLHTEIAKLLTKKHINEYNG